MTALKKSSYKNYIHKIKKKILKFLTAVNNCQQLWGWGCLLSYILLEVREEKQISRLKMKILNLILKALTPLGWYVLEALTQVKCQLLEALAPLKCKVL